ncbi:hypothetical protein M0Q50_04310 [bacterium]|jgi:hypothetical protein|nr:hypothetical protein [bacterium]
MKKIMTILFVLITMFVNAQINDSISESELQKIDSTYKADYVEETLFVPNAIAPNCTPIGVRLFKPLGTNLLEYEIWIFDSRGNQVWYSNKLIDGTPSESWDGYLGGKILPSDVYIWKITEVHYDISSYKGGFCLGLYNGFEKKTHFGSIFLIR